MNKEIEEKFIRTFIDKRMQERFQFELTHVNPEKRDYAIQRFAHTADKIYQV